MLLEVSLVKSNHSPSRALQFFRWRHAYDLCVQDVRNVQELPNVRFIPISLPYILLFRWIILYNFSHRRYQEHCILAVVEGWADGWRQCPFISAIDFIYHQTSWGQVLVRALWEKPCFNFLARRALWGSCSNKCIFFKISDEKLSRWNAIDFCSAPDRRQKLSVNTVCMDDFEWVHVPEKRLVESAL